MQEEVQEEYGDERLLEGDLFSIGITVLCLADLNFRLTQRKILKRARKSLKKISSKKRLCEILESLIFNCRDSTEKQAKSMFPNFNVGYFSGLSKYQDRFEDYLQEKQCQEISFSFRRDEDQHSELAKRKEFEREQKIAAYNYLQINESLKARDCYESVLKDYLVSGHVEEAKPFFYEIYSEILSDKSVHCSPLFYSTLGAYLHLAKSNEGARSVFKVGLKQCKERFDTLILLNNYAYTCDFKGHSAFSYLQRAYNIIKESETSLQTIAFSCKHGCKAFNVINKGQ